MSAKFIGVYPAITTKFNTDFSIDFEGFERKIEGQIAAGVDGIVLGGTLGEASTLTTKEKSELVQFTKKASAGRIPVVVNIAEQSTQDAIAVAKTAEKDGVDGLMMLPPMRYKADDLETVTYFKAVADNTKLPIMIYNNPIDYKIMVTLDMFEQLAKCKNIVAVKESTRDTTNITRMINRFGDRFNILGGVDTLAVESLVMGSCGWVAGLVCAFPEETVAIYRLVKVGRINEALTIFRWFLPLLELDINPKLVQNIKLAEQCTGIGTEIVRPPRLPLYGKEREVVLQMINSCLASRPALPDYHSIKL